MHEQEIEKLEQLLNDGRPKSKLERLSIQRQIDDLRNAHTRGLVWDEAEADRVCWFFDQMCHWKGEWGGQPIDWQPWQVYAVTRPLFGWYRGKTRKEGGKRRYRVAWVEIPRKNGKTTWGAAVMLFGLAFDMENGAEVYAAATRRDQAAIILQDAKEMIGRFPALRERCGRFKDSVTFHPLKSKIATLPHMPEKLDGLMQHFAIIDEVHAHKTRDQWDVMLGGTGARSQPLQVGITTAGADRGPMCIAWEQHEYARNVLSGHYDDDEYFAFIACADKGDDPHDEQTWRKANPNYEVSVKREFLAQLSKHGKESPPALANFFRKHLNVWVGKHVKAIDIDRWRELYEKDSVDLDGKDAYCGIDLGFTNDLAACALVFPEIEPFSEENTTEVEEEMKPANRITSCHVRCRFWLPEGGVRPLTDEPWASWVRDGWLEVTPGNSTDIRAIYQAVVDDDEQYVIQQVALDPSNARQVGSEFVEYGESMGKDPEFAFFQRQQTTYYNECCQELVAMVADGRIRHDNNPILTWCMDNLQFRSDSEGRVKPDKEKSSEKIDGAVAVLMALARAMFADCQPNVYETRGLR